MKAIAAFATALIASSSALASIPCLPVSTSTAEHSTQFGAIELIEEIRTLDPGVQPDPLCANEWTKYHLRWQSADGAVRVVFTDDGEKVHTLVDLPQRQCMIMREFWQFSGRVGEPELFRGMAKQLRSIVRTCPTMTVAERQHFMRAFASTADDFAPAIEALKQRTMATFGGWSHRCVRSAPYSAYSRFLPCIMPNQKKN